MHEPALKAGLNTATIAVLVVAFSAGYFLQQYRQGREAGAPTGADGLQVGAQQERQESTSAAPDDEPPAAIGARRPDFSQRDMLGVLRNAEEWNDSVVVLNFWASWCPPCRTEIPWFIDMQAQYQGLQFVGIAMQETEEIVAFVEEHGINYPVLTGTRATLQLMTRYGNDTGALPYTVFIDRHGIIAGQHLGPLSREALHDIVLALLDDPMKPGDRQ